jgi:hypothetical protein
MQNLGLAAQLAVPITAPMGSAITSENLLQMKASRGSSRDGTLASTRPAGSRVGKSFMEWMAASMRFSNRASSSSFVKAPFHQPQAGGGPLCGHRLR